MGLFEHFPYSNFHELNLDWLFKKVLGLSEDIENINADILAGRQEIQEKLQEMIDDGSFAEILSQVAISANNVTSNFLQTSVSGAPLPTNVPLESWTAQTFYQAYDSYLGEHEEGSFTSVNEGSDESGTAIKSYIWHSAQFNNTPLNTSSDAAYSGQPLGYTFYPQVGHTGRWLVFTSGIHGDEKLAMFNLWDVIRHIITADAEWARFIRNNFNIMVVPCCNPWGVNNNTRLTSIGVDLNRNFGYNWDNYNPPDTDLYPKGSSAYECQAAQVLRDMFIGNETLGTAPRYFGNSILEKQGTVFIDFHNFRGAGSYADYLSMYYFSDFTMKLAALRCGTWLRSYLESAGADMSIFGTRSINFANIANSPTFINTIYHKGWKYAGLSENRIRMTLDTDYTNLDSRAGFQNIAHLILDSAVSVYGAKPASMITGHELPMDYNETLETLCAKIPPGATFKYIVTSAGSAPQTLINQMPLYRRTTFVAGMLEISKSFGLNPVGICSYTFTNANYRNQSYWGMIGQDDGQTVFSGWIERQPKAIYQARDFANPANVDILALERTALSDLGGITFLRIFSTDESVSGGRFPMQETDGNVICFGSLRGNAACCTLIYATARSGCWIRTDYLQRENGNADWNRTTEGAWQEFVAAIG